MNTKQFPFHRLLEPTIDIQDEKNAMRQSMLQDELHERNMIDLEYFCEYMATSYYMNTDGEDLMAMETILSKLNHECFAYEHELKDLLEYFKEL